MNQTGRDATVLGFPQPHSDPLNYLNKHSETEDLGAGVNDKNNGQSGEYSNEQEKTIEPIWIMWSGTCEYFIDDYFCI